MFSFVIIGWCHFRPFLQGANAVRKLYGETKNKSVTARELCSRCQIKDVTNIVHCKHVIGEVRLPSLMENIVGCIYR